MESTLKTNTEKLRRDLRTYGRRLDEEGIARAAMVLSQRSENAVKRDFLNYFRQRPTYGLAGKTVRSVRLRASVRALVVDKSRFGIRTNVVYARIHELGGRTRPHTIYPKRAKALRFMKGGKAIFAKKIHHPGSQMPARHWISEPMTKELRLYLKEFKLHLEKPL